LAYPKPSKAFSCLCERVHRLPKDFSTALRGQLARKKILQPSCARNSPEKRFFNRPARATPQKKDSSTVLRAQLARKKIFQPSCARRLSA
jgi:hypothetical protein